MSNMRETAQNFIEACDGGKCWEGCQAYCHDNATFSVQSPALADIDTVQAYTEWAKAILTPMPDGSFELRSLGIDEDRGSATAYLVFRGTHTGEGGPVPPTGQSTETDYVYCLNFEGDKIRHITKTWNDAFALQQLGWA